MSRFPSWPGGLAAGPKRLASVTLVCLPLLAGCLSASPPAGSMPPFRTYREGAFSFEYPAWPDDPGKDPSALVAVVDGAMGVWLRAYPGYPQFALRLGKEYIARNPGMKLLAESGPDDPHPWLEQTALLGEQTIHTRTDYVYCNDKTYAVIVAAAEPVLPAAAAIFQRVRQSASCGEAVQLPRVSSGRIGMVVNPPGGDYSRQAAALHEVAAIGVQVSQLHFAWGNIERQAGQYDWSVADDLIASCQAEGLAVSVAIALPDGDTIGKLPADLAGQGLGDPALQERFARFVAAFASRYGDGIRYLEIGHEVDAYLAGHRAEVDAFAALFRAARGAARAARPALPVGIIVAFPQAERSGMLSLVAQLAEADVVAYTVYLCDGNGRFPPPPADLSPTLDRALAAAGERPVLISGTGWSTAPENGGSELHQAEYVQALFRALASRRRRIAFLAWGALHDGLPDRCPQDGMPTSDRSAQGSASFLCSLGLRDRDGNPKLGWGVFVREARSYLLASETE